MGKKRKAQDQQPTGGGKEFDLVTIAYGDLTDEALIAWIDLCIAIEEREAFAQDCHAPNQS